MHEPQAEPSLEPSWQRGDAQGYYEPEPREPVAELEDAEPEMEL